MAQGLNTDLLKQVIAATLSPDSSIRRNAEQSLHDAQRTSGYPLAILQLVANANASEAAIRQAAAVNFKNTIKKGWDEHREDGNEGIVISPTDRLTIKSHLVQLMCTVPDQIQAQLSESISQIAMVDYPENWENLLPELVQQFHSTDPSVQIGVLKTANSIFKRFRYVQRSDELYKVILYTLQGVQAPLLTLFKTLGQAVDAAPNDSVQLKTRFEALRLVCRIFYSLNYQDLPEFFEDHMKEWMEDFAKYLQYQNPLLVDASEELEPSPIDKLQAAIINNLALYADKDEEPFMDYLPNFTTLVWNLLLTTTAFPKHDTLATTSIKFLSGLVQKLMHKNLFQEESTLREIVLKIVIPNLMFRESDEERFEDDPQEFIATEVEGSDSESRRKCSQDLLRSMCRHFESETTKICAEHVGSMLAEYASDPSGKWAAKDAAINLMMGIAIRKESSLGVAEVNDAVNVLDFFQTQILPELQEMNHTSRPVVKATSIKFVSTFRNQFTRENLAQLMPMLIHHLGSPVVVVHTFAAYAIERILFTKEDVGGKKKPKIGSAELQPTVEPLFSGLFAIIDNTVWNENDYVMKCVMRSLSTLGEDVLPVTNIVIEKLTAALAQVAKNPRNPQFNHYLFESIAVLVRNVCSKEPNATSSFEPLLFDPFTTILQMDIAEFTPYVFQILAQLLEYRPAESGLGPAYTSLFQPMLTPALWEQKGNVPALTRLMQAYIKKAPGDLVQHLNPILGVFQKLISVRSTESSAFDLLSSAICFFPQEHMESKLATVFQILLVRLQASAKAPRYKRLVTNFFALFVGKFGPHVYVDRLSAMQSGLGITLLEQVWLPRLTEDAPVQRMESKIQMIALTKLLCEHPALLADQTGRQIWSTALAAAVMIATSNPFKVSTELGDDDEDLEVGFDSQFSRLKFATKPAEDYFPEVADPVAAFVQSLHHLCSSRPGHFLPLIQQGLSVDPELSSGLEAMCQQVGVHLV